MHLYTVTSATYIHANMPVYMYVYFGLKDSPIYVPLGILNPKQKLGMKIEASMSGD